jgi:hypothetical protein
MTSFEKDRIKGQRAARAIKVLQMYVDEFDIDPEDAEAMLIADLIHAAEVYDRDFEAQVLQARKWVKQREDG